MFWRTRSKVIDFVGDLLQVDAFDVLVQRDWRRPGVLRLLERLHSPPLALVGERVVHGGGVVRADAARVDQLAVGWPAESGGR